MPNQKLTFTTTINAPVETVWNSMLGPETYKVWTSAFEPSSYYEGSWEQGAEIKFLSEDMEGMVGIIEVNQLYRYISIEYTGFLKDGELNLESPGATDIVGSHENYTFTPISDQQTTLDIEMDSSAEYAEYMSQAWPKALEKLKSLCENADTY
jgi:uncharacterized protein YndB with AHSA1/START domain